MDKYIIVAGVVKPKLFALLECKRILDAAFNKKYRGEHPTLTPQMFEHYTAAEMQRMGEYRGVD